MKFVMLLLLVFSEGEATTTGLKFDSMEACEKYRVKIHETIAAYNAKDSPKVMQYAASCLAVKQAPQGTEI